MVRSFSTTTTSLALQDLETQTAVLVNYVQKIHPSVIDDCVELEIRRPGLTRVLGLMAPNGADGGTSPLLLSESDRLEGVPVQRQLVVHSPTLPAERSSPSAVPSGSGLISK